MSWSGLDAGTVEICESEYRVLSTVDDWVETRPQPLVYLSRYSVLYFLILLGFLLATKAITVTIWPHRYAARRNTAG